MLLVSIVVTIITISMQIINDKTLKRKCFRFDERICGKLIVIELYMYIHMYIYMRWLLSEKTGFVHFIATARNPIIRKARQKPIGGF